MRSSKIGIEGELDSYLAQEFTVNRKNGKGKKVIKSMDGSFDLATPRDRKGTFTPKLIKKYQTTLSDDLEQKIIALYGLGMSYRDISSHIEEMYGLEVSTVTQSDVTDRRLGRVKNRQQCLPGATEHNTLHQPNGVH